MSYLTIYGQKPHNNFLSETQPRNLLLTDNTTAQVPENNNQISPNGTTDKRVKEVWSKHTFLNNTTVNHYFNAMSWAENKTADNDEPIEENAEDEKIEVVEDEPPVATTVEKEEEPTPSHHARRPMNAFLIFCKKHRPIVRERFTNLENRGVTKILGEWWALLTKEEKTPYNDLAKEYKHAFLIANPDFKWYKLPAPPLRTLHVRTPIQLKPPNPSRTPSEFTPGKLADESQLGSLTSLMNNNNNNFPRPPENNNNIDKNNDPPVYETHISPVNFIKTNLPPKPFKKRTFNDKLPDNKHVVRNILPDDSQNMTQQEIMNKVVENIYTKDEDGKEVRKSGRQCKGKLYEKFMVEGRLLGNKREAKLTSQRCSEAMETEISHKLEDPPNLDLTIKRLAERTNMKSLLAEGEEEEKPRIRTISVESSASGPVSDFNLNSRISDLPTFSYDTFHQRKRESKKRKNRIRVDDSKSKVARVVETHPVGSKKRKNKQSITHLEKNTEELASGLLALATLAEVAANTQKINDEAA